MEDTQTIQDEQVPTQQDPPSKRLFDGLVQGKLYTKSYDEFKKQFSNSESIAKLHQGLSEKKLYTKGVDDFTNQYFSDTKKKNLTSSVSVQPTEVGLPNTPTVEPPQELDPISASLDAEEKKAAKKEISLGAGGMAMGTQSSTIPDTELNNQGEETSKKLKAQGVDSKEVASMFNGLPKEMLTPENLTHFNEQLKNEPTKLDVTLSHYKWAPEVMAKATLDEKQFLSNIASAGTYEDKRKAIQAAIPIIRKHSDDTDKGQKNFAAEASLIYGSNLAHNPTKFDNTPEVKELGLTPNQVGAYQFLQDTQPDKAEQYKALFIDKSKIAKDDYELQYGLEEKGLKLEQIGASLKQNAATYDKEQINKEIAKYNQIADVRPFTPQEQLQVAQLQQEQAQNKQVFDSIETDKQSILQGTKYLRTQRHDADQMATELLGSKDNFGEWALKELGKGVSNTVTGTLDFATAPFQSEDKNSMRMMQLIGGNAIDEESTGVPQSKQTKIAWKPAVDKELADQIDKVKNDDALTDTEKHDKVVDLLMANPTKHRMIGIDGGETNVNLNSLVYGTAQLAIGLVPFIAVTAATGGGASASTLRGLASEVTAATVTGLNSELTEAIKRGDANPHAIAAIRTFVNSIALTGASTVSEIKAMAGKIGNPAIEKLIGNLSDKEVLSALRHEPESLSLLRKTYNLGTDIGKAAFNNAGGAAKITAFTTAGQAVNDTISGETKPFEDYVKEGGIELLKFFTLGTSLAGISRIGKEPSDLNKTALYEAAKSPEAFLQVLDKKLADRTISKEDATQIKSNIESAKKVMDKVPMVDAKGKELADASKRDLLFLKLQEQDIDEVLKKDIPKELADKVGKRLEGIHEKMDEIYKGTFLANPVIKPIERNVNDSAKIADENARKLTAKTIEPIQPITAEPEGQGVKEAIPRSPDAVGQGEPKPADAVLDEVKKHEEDRDAEIAKVEKPDIKLELVQSKDLVNSKDPIGNKKIHDDIKDRYKRLKALIECL